FLSLWPVAGWAESGRSAGRLSAGPAGATVALDVESEAEESAQAMPGTGAGTIPAQSASAAMP
ncbi:MAG: hypothetical protein K0U84_24690, partial [Actinomycetia bacterium]|nr:hypothetical protein [Actinomycetes bacterium]